MSKHPHNQIILQSNKIKLLHFREALGKKKKNPHIFKQLCWSWTQHSQSSLGGGHVFSPSLSRFLALKGHNSKAELFRAYSFLKCVKDDSLKKKKEMMSQSYLTPLPNFLHLPPCNCCSKIWSFQFAFTQFNNIYWNIHSQELFHLLVPSCKEKEFKEISF